MASAEVKTDFSYTEVAVENHCMQPAHCGIDFDDDIICLDAVEERRPVLLPIKQIMRLHLSEQCVNPGCQAVANETEKLRNKLNALENLGNKLRTLCSTQQSEIAKLNEEADKNRRKIVMMEGVIKRQGATIRDLEARFNFMQKSNRSTLQNRSVNNIVRAEQSMTQRRVSSDPNFMCYNGASPTNNTSPKISVDQPPRLSNGLVKPPGYATPSPRSTVSCPAPSPSSPKTGRMKLHVPFAHSSLLLEFSSPVSTPVLDYPVDLQRCRIAAHSELTIEITTEPSNFLLTKKVQGVVKHASSLRSRAQKAKIYCYLESALSVRGWIPSSEYTFKNSDKMKFDIIFAKEQQVSRFDRIVAFAFACVGNSKLLTSRVVFNVGEQAENISKKQVAQQNKSVGAMDTSSKTSASDNRPPAVRVGHDSNFEVYVP
ncbi:hypothetical protein Q1695_009057 [Nippostrongylus brasiliensis]|nr:hypothetical protein Q1695_009057 [Nippostrongylus brasiliensis]